jgi:hypothetical protein
MYLKILLLLATINLGLIDFGNSQNGYTLLYKKCSEIESFQDFLNSDNNTFSMYKFGKTEFKQNETYCVKIKYAHVEDINNMLILFNTPISSIECYFETENGKIQVYRSGIFENYENQLIRSGDKNKIYINSKLKTMK